MATCGQHSLIKQEQVLLNSDKIKVWGQCSLFVLTQYRLFDDKMKPCKISLV